MALKFKKWAWVVLKTYGLYFEWFTGWNIAVPSFTPTPTSSIYLNQSMCWNQIPEPVDCIVV